MDIFTGILLLGGIFGVLWIRSHLSKQTPNKQPKIYNLPGDGRFNLDIVGEASFQDNLLQICGRKNKKGHEKKTIAYLILEDSNPVDKNAVRVESEGKIVGYLARAHAIKYRDYLKQYQLSNIIGTCPALITGGWDRGNGDEGNFGVKLDFTL